MILDLAKRYLIMSKEDMSGLDKVFNVDESPEAEVETQWFSWTSPPKMAPTQQTNGAGLGETS